MDARPANVEVPDEEILAAVASGSPGAVAALYDRHAALLFGLAVRILGNRAEAEEVLREVFLEAWERATARPSAGEPRRWLVALTRARALDRLRRSPTRDRRTDESVRQATRLPVAAAGETHLPPEGVRSRHAFAEIPEAHRQALRLAYFSGLTETDVAARLDRPPGTVKTQIRLGLRKLRDLLREPAPPS